MALQAVELGRPDEALRLVHLGHATAVGGHAVSTGNSIFLASIQARAHAARNDVSGCDRALGQAVEQLFWAESDDEPSEVGIRPFSLRGVRPAPKAEVEPGASYEYDPRRQITLVRTAEGTLLPLSKHTRPGATPSAGTSETRDGDGSPPPAEEMLPPDYQQD